MVVISAYTTNGDYPQLADQLIKSCDKFGLRHSVTEMGGRSTWLETVRNKPSWILSRLFELREAVLWLDADCEIIRLPSLLFGMSHDFAAYNWKADHGTHVGYDPNQLQVSGGVLYFGYTAPAIELLGHWQTEVAYRPNAYGTDPSLNVAFNNYRPPVRAMWLPKSYNRHENHWPDVEPVINHKFLNRKHSDAVDAEFNGLPVQYMFHYRDVYDMAVREAKDGARFVEIGCWLGESSSYMARKIRDSGKKIEFSCVDTWKGSEGIAWMKPYLERCGGDMLPAWKRRMADRGVSEYARPIQLPSVEAAKLFEDESLDFVMIDGDHQYEAVLADIEAWLPKVKHGGLLTGDDYDEASHSGVVQAVRESLNDFTTMVRSWIYRKP